jgi:hypothetical protein
MDVKLLLEKVNYYGVRIEGKPCSVIITWHCMLHPGQLSSVKQEVIMTYEALDLCPLIVQRLNASLWKAFKQWELGLIHSGNYYNLEDKVAFDGVGNDVILVRLVQYLITQMFCNKNNSDDIKVAMVERLRKTTHKMISWLWCCGPVDVHHIGVAPIVQEHVISNKVLDANFETKIAGFEHTEVRLSSFKQWDPGRFVSMKNYLSTTLRTRLVLKG